MLRWIHNRDRFRVVTQRVSFQSSVRVLKERRTGLLWVLKQGFPGDPDAQNEVALARLQCALGHPAGDLTRDAACLQHAPLLKLSLRAIQQHQLDPGHVQDALRRVPTDLAEATLALHLDDLDSAHSRHIRTRIAANLATFESIPERCAKLLTRPFGRRLLLRELQRVRKHDAPPPDRTTGPWSAGEPWQPITPSPPGRDADQEQEDPNR